MLGGVDGSGDIEPLQPAVPGLAGRVDLRSERLRGSGRAELARVELAHVDLPGRELQDRHLQLGEPALHLPPHAVSLSAHPPVCRSRRPEPQALRCEELAGGCQDSFVDARISRSPASPPPRAHVPIVTAQRPRGFGYHRIATG